LKVSVICFDDEMVTVVVVADDAMCNDIKKKRREIDVVQSFDIIIGERTCKKLHTNKQTNKKKKNKKFKKLRKKEKEFQHDPLRNKNKVLFQRESKKNHFITLLSFHFFTLGFVKPLRGNSMMTIPLRTLRNHLKCCSQRQHHRS